MGVLSSLAFRFFSNKMTNATGLALAFSVSRKLCEFYASANKNGAVRVYCSKIDEIARKCNWQQLFLVFGEEVAQ